MLVPVPPPEDRPLRVLVSFAPEDNELKDQLVRHLRGLGRFAKIEVWDLDRVRAGDDRRRAFDDALGHAGAALLLISADYLALDFLQEVEVPKLLEKRRVGGLRVIPVLLRTCDWQEDPRLQGLTALPRSRQAIASYQGDERDQALTEVVREIVGVLREERAQGPAPAAHPYDRLLAGILDVEASPRIRDFLDAYVEHPGFFCGREDDVDRVRAWVDDEGAAPNLLVTAPAGRGKSALLVRLAISLTARVEVAFVPISLRLDTCRPEVFLACLVARLLAMHEEEVPDLSRTPRGALERRVRELLERPLSRERTALVILDGVDEAVDWRISPGLLPARHASSNRVIVSARALPDDPGGDLWLQRLGWPRALTKTIELPLLEEADVAAVLARQTEPARRRWSGDPRAIEELTRLCRGEPLTLWLLLEVLDNLDDPATLASVKPGFAAVFEAWREDQRKQWGTATPEDEPAVMALLHLLSAAEGPLTRADVLALTPGEIHGNGLLLDKTLRSLSRMVHGAGTTSGYVLAHPGFAQHLGDQLDLVPWRERLAAYVREKAEALAAGDLRPAKVPRYVVRNRAAHLHAGGAPLAAWMWLCSRRWYDAWQAHEPGAVAFVRDVARAWGEVAARSGDGADHLAAEARCALAHGSATSGVASLDLHLLRQLIEHKIWTPEEAFAHVRAAPLAQHLDGSRDALLKELARHAPAELLPQLLDVACDLWDKPGSGNVSRAVLPYAAAKAPREALIRLQKIEHPWVRASLVAVLAKHAPPPHREIALHALREVIPVIPSPWWRAQVLAELAELVNEPERSQRRGEALAAAREIPEAEVNARVHVLTLLAPTSPEATEAAIRAASHLSDADHRAFSLGELITKLHPSGRSEAIRRFRAEAEAAAKPVEQANRWHKLLELVPEDRTEDLRRAFSAIALVADPGERVSALLALFARERSGAPPGWWPEATAGAREILSTIADPGLRLGALSRLHGALPPGETWRIAEPAWHLVDEALCGPEAHRFAEVVGGPLWEAPVETALDQARRVALPALQAELLADVACRLPFDAREPVVEEAFTAARAVESHSLRAHRVLRLLYMVTPAREPAVIAALDEAITSIPEPYQQVGFLLDLARSFGEHWPEAIDAAAESVRSHDLPHLRFDHLCQLVEVTRGARREALFDEALAEARSGSAASGPARCFSRLADLAPTPRRRALLNEGRAATEHIGDAAACLDAALSYAPDLPADDALDLAGWIDERPPGARATAYLALLERAPDTAERLFDRALSAVQEAEPETVSAATRAALLGRLAQVAPPAGRRGVLREALDTARAELAAIFRPTPSALLEDPYSSGYGDMRDGHVAAALSWLAPELPEEWVSEALELAEGIAYHRPGADPMAPLIQRLDEAERAPRVEALLAKDLRAPAAGSDPRQRRRALVEILGGFLPLERRLALEDELPGQPGEPPWLWPDLPEQDLETRLERWLSPHPRAHSTPDTLRGAILRLPPSRMSAVLSWLLARIPTLPPSDATQILVRFLPFLPDDQVDRYLAMAATHGIGGLQWLATATSRLDGHRLDRALALVVADRSRGGPRDPRLEALAAVGAARLKLPDAPRAYLRRLLHETLRARSETRGEALATLEALRLLVVGLGGAPAALAVVRAIRDAGKDWP